MPDSNRTRMPKRQLSSSFNSSTARIAPSSSSKIIDAVGAPRSSSPSSTASMVPTLAKAKRSAGASLPRILVTATARPPAGFDSRSSQISSGRSCVRTTRGPWSWSSTRQMSVPGSAASIAARHASTLSGSFFNNSLIFLMSTTDASGRNNVFSSSSSILLNFPGGQDCNPSSEKMYETCLLKEASYCCTRSWSRGRSTHALLMETSSESSSAARIRASPSWFLSNDFKRGNAASSLSGIEYEPASLIEASCARPSSNSASSAKSASTCLRSAALCFFVFLSTGCAACSWR
mmetsp:Transcript_5568/g.14075  ORF Transcript_5568/g.14075 Transcript_5568/m.14075 type:complete len:291 (+) Transcript_5568:799-1671(+)